MGRKCAHRRQLDQLVSLQRLCNLKDLVGDSLRGRSTVVDVELDTEIRGGVVTGSQENPSVRLPRPDDVGCSWSRKDSALTDDELLDSVTGCDLDDFLDRFGNIVSAVTSDHQGRALGSGWGHGIESGLNEILGVVLSQMKEGGISVWKSHVIRDEVANLLLEDVDPFPQTRSAGLLVGEGGRGDLFN